LFRPCKKAGPKAGKLTRLLQIKPNVFWRKQREPLQGRCWQRAVLNLANMEGNKSQPGCSLVNERGVIFLQQLKGLICKANQITGNET